MKTIYSLKEINMIISNSVSIPKKHCRQTIKDSYYIDGYLMAFNQILTAFNGDQYYD